MKNVVSTHVWKISTRLLTNVKNVTKFCIFENRHWEYF